MIEQDGICYRIYRGNESYWLFKPIPPFVVGLSHSMLCFRDMSDIISSDLPEWVKEEIGKVAERRYAQRPCVGDWGYTYPL